MRPPELEDPDFAQTYVERWLPNKAQRTAVLTCLGESLRAAHDAAPECWGLSLLMKDRLLRFNVGMVNMFIVAPNGTQTLLVDRQALPAKSRWRTEKASYRNAPSADVVVVPSTDLARAYEQLREGQVRAIQEAARLRSVYPKRWRTAHSPGLLAYMRRLLDIDLPDPGYEDERGSGGSRTSPGRQPIIDAELAAFEGETRYHFVRHCSREDQLRDVKIAEALQRNAGRLVCEVPGCGFDFAAKYGPLGAGYAHVHHQQPLIARDTASETRLSDLAIVCANCHAMIHRGGACRDLDELLQGE